MNTNELPERNFKITYNRIKLLKQEGSDKGKFLHNPTCMTEGSWGERELGLLLEKNTKRVK